MGEVQAAARQQERYEELAAAAIRALAGERDLHFRARRLHRGRRRLPAFAPHLHPEVERDDFASFRGAADGLALRLKLSDAAVHAALAPAEPLRRMLFDLFEQFRVEALAGDHHVRWPGVKRNLDHRFERWSRAYVDGGLADGARGLLLFTVAQIVRTRLTGTPAPEDIEDLMEATRAGIVPVLGHALARLRRGRGDQRTYAGAALELAGTVAGWLEQSGEGGAGREAADGSAERDARTAFGFVLERDEPAQADAPATVVTGTSRLIEGAADAGYRVWTTAHDREWSPAATMRADELDGYRRRLDARIAAQGVNLARLARQLEALLAEPRRDDWAGAQEEGLIDGRRLAQLVASPAERRLFRRERREPKADAVVAFVVDCSGSMRQHIESVAMLLDVLVRALEMAGVATEVLGFTTGAWNGGRPKREWERAGRPAHPGRLNEVAHLVFKSAATPWRHARRGMAAMLRPDLFKEGVDGEALAWAAARLARRDERRKLLLAVSDGCPMDTATGLANDPHYLDHHLQQVAASIETAGDIGLAALGVGLDLSPYYGRCHAIDIEAGLGNQVFDEVVALLGRGSRR